MLLGVFSKTKKKQPKNIGKWKLIPKQGLKNSPLLFKVTKRSYIYGSNESILGEEEAGWTGAKKPPLSKERRKFLNFQT
jgi:hypothetical protein